MARTVCCVSRSLLVRSYGFIRARCYGTKRLPSIYTTDPIDPNEKTFEKILIANRGEIACRVIKTARAMGIKTVAVYSLADSNALHVKMADESVCIGSAPASESYLRMDRIMEAVKKTGAQAVHPGYGFLSENHLFVEMLEKEGISFIGPSAAAITGMGDKIESKRLAKHANVNIIPGFDGVVKDADHCISIAKEIGYPVMVKASAGGGGKGMRIVQNDGEAREGFRLATQEAASSFGDSRILVEKFVEQPRHIEIQLLGDKQGNVIHLLERECSIQRRNQKVIEECPSVFIDPETRAKMGAQAISLAKKIGYSSAGTVEFLVDHERKFYFLEMNTRLQVEHPVTECVTGVDIVHQMIRVAAGLPLKLKQDDIPMNGWAVESRVYAEDPFKNFGMPSIGRLYKYIEPTHIPNVRCDSGIEEGSEISIYYDPMICKMVCYGSSRPEALSTTVHALDSYVIRGVTHNIPLLRDVVTEKKFMEGNITTKYLYETYPDGFKGRQLGEKQREELATIVACMHVKDVLRSRKVLNERKEMLVHTHAEEWDLVVTVDEHDVECHVEQGDKKFEVEIGGKTFTMEDNFTLADAVVTANVNGRDSLVQVIRKTASGLVRIRYQGTPFNVRVLSDMAFQFMQMMPEVPKLDVSKAIISPMPGMVKSINCEVGSTVLEGQEVCVIEAMKMQNSLTAAITGKVKAVHCKAGQTVEEESILVEFE